MEIWSIIVSTLGVGGIISGIILRKIDAMERKQEKREEYRVRESVLIFRGLEAVGHVAEVAATLNRNGAEPTPEEKTAFEYYRAYKDDLHEFLLEQNAARNHGK